MQEKVLDNMVGLNFILSSQCIWICYSWKIKQYIKILQSWYENSMFMLLLKLRDLQMIVIAFEISCQPSWNFTISSNPLFPVSCFNWKYKIRKCTLKVYSFSLKKYWSHLLHNNLLQNNTQILCSKPGRILLSFVSTYQSAILVYFLYLIRT